MDWTSIIILVVSTILQIALAPKQEKPTAATLSDFSIPTAEEDRAVPVLFGERVITGSNVIGYGDLSHDEIKGGGLFSHPTLGYRYYLYLHFALGIGPFNAITKITVGDVVAWTGNITDNASGEIRNDDLFGGDSSEGGMSGVFDVLFGRTTQTQSPFLLEKLGHPVPAYRGTQCLLWKTGMQAGPPQAFGAPTSIRSGKIGNSPYLKPWAITGWRTTEGWQNDDPWYPEAATIGDTGMNPAHILYQLFTDTRYGEGSPATVLDDAKMRAFADQMVTEGFALNMIWNTGSSIQDFAKIICDHIGGFVVLDRTTNKRYIKLVRGDYDASTLQVFDESMISEMSSFQRRAWGETVNELTLNYTDKESQDLTPVTIQDLANIRAQQGRVNQTLTYEGITDPALARVVAARELTARSLPLAYCTFKVNRRFWGYNKGDVFKLNWAQEGISGVVFRVVGLHRGTLTDGVISVDAVEDVYALTGLNYTEVQPTGSAPPRVTPITPPAETGNTVISATLTVPPIDPSDGAIYIVPVGATDIWADHVGQVAYWDASTASWIYTDIPNGTIIYANDTGKYVSVVNGTISDSPLGQTTLAASSVTYDDSATALGATDVQKAIEAIVATLGSPINVRAFAGDRWFGSTLDQTLYDTTDGVDWLQRDSTQESSFFRLFMRPYTAASADPVYFALKANQVGQSVSEDIYGDWTYVTVGTEALTGIRYMPYDGAGGTTYVWQGSTIMKSTDDCATFASPAAIVSTYAEEVLDDAPDLWLRLGDDSANTARDSGSGGNDARFIPGVGTSGNSHSSVSGILPGGLALAFAGTYTYVEPRTFADGAIDIIKQNGTFTNFTDFSIELWIKKNGVAIGDSGATGMTLYSQSYYAAAGGGSFAVIDKVLLQCYVDGGGHLYLTLTVGGGAGAAITVASPTSTDLWDGAGHHVVATYNATTQKIVLYLDNVALISVTPGAAAALDATGTIYSSVFGTNFNATAASMASIVDELAIYPTELSAARIAIHYDRGTLGISNNVNIKEIFHDLVNARHLVFGEIIDPVSTSVTQYRPKVFVSTDGLITLSELSAIAVTPATDDSRIVAVARQGGEDQVDLAYRFLFTEINAHKPFTNSVQIYYYSDGTYEYALIDQGGTPQFRKTTIADGTSVGRAIMPSGYMVPGVQRGSAFYAVYINVPPTSGHLGTGSNIVRFLLPDGTDDIFYNQYVGPVGGPVDSAGGVLNGTKHIRLTPTTNQLWFGSQAQVSRLDPDTLHLITAHAYAGCDDGDCDDTYWYSYILPSAGVTHIVKADLATGTPATLVGTTTADTNYIDMCVANGYLYAAYSDTRSGTGYIRPPYITRHDLATGAQDLAFNPAWGRTYLDSREFWTKSGPFIAIGDPGNKIVIDTTDGVNPTIYRGDAFGVLLARNPSTVVLAISADQGDTWTLNEHGGDPAPTGAASLIHDGVHFLLGGKGFSGISSDMVSFTYSSDLLSGLPSSETLSTLFTDSAGRTMGALSSGSGFAGSAFTTDGLVWSLGPRIKALAKDVSFNNENVGLPASDLQTGIDLIAGSWGIIRQQVFGD